MRSNSLLATKSQALLKARSPSALNAGATRPLLGRGDIRHEPFETGNAGAFSARVRGIDERAAMEDELGRGAGGRIRRKEYRDTLSYSGRHRFEPY
jgi:hypothetical protein